MRELLLHRVAGLTSSSSGTTSPQPATIRWRSPSASEGSSSSSSAGGLQPNDGAGCCCWCRHWGWASLCCWLRRSAFLILPSAAISSNDAWREGVTRFVGCAEVVKTQEPPAAPSSGATAFNSCSNLLARGAREHMLSSLPAPRGRGLAPLPLLLAVRWVRPPWPHCSPTPAVAWYSRRTRKFFVAASCRSVLTFCVWKTSLVTVVNPENVCVPG